MKTNICTLSIVLFVSGLVFGQVAGGGAKAPVGPKLWLDSKAIDLGVIAVGQQEIEGVILGRYRCGGGADQCFCFGFAAVGEEAVRVDSTCDEDGAGGVGGEVYQYAGSFSNGIWVRSSGFCGCGEYRPG